ncbi:hypothetical protein [Streptomyces sp. TBY4]|uniref:hypothetical protein n=1 Tax=Streptomyces sp. TBY4 TaxID=2962030 RepID=UPI0020B7E07D|nr:hypothetical protein [Streptomyces sp. TBY4]MCP3760526.1 hypothetical protein [Streptomyces sp. TBY4]
MTDIRPVPLTEAVTALRAAGDACRGFLGVDPVTQNDALLVKELTRTGAQFFRSDGALVGCLTNEDQLRQVYVATTTADPEPLRAFLAFLDTYRRITSYVALLPSGNPTLPAFEKCGFTQVGNLKDHHFQAGRHQDVPVYFASAEVACRP